MMWKSGLTVYSVCFLHCLFWGSATANDGLLPNGNFEEAPQSWAVVGNVIVGQNLLPQWKIDGLVEYISSSDQRNQLQFIIPDNGHAVQLGNNGLISQQIQGLKKGSSYSISFSVSKACGTPVNLNVTVKPYSQVFLIKTVYDSNGWDVYAWGFQAVSEAQEVVLLNPDEDYNNPNCGPLIDGVAIKEIINPPRSKAVKVDLVNDLVTNGNFEDGPHDYLNGSHGILLPPSVLRHSPLPGWTINSNQPSKYIDSTHFSVPQGHKAVELFSGLDSILSQTVDTVPRSSYRLSFAVGDANNACKGPLMVQATVGNQTFKVPYESKGTGGFKKAEFTFTANFPTTRIAFKSLSSIKKSDNSGNLCGPVVDQVQVLAL